MRNAWMIGVALVLVVSGHGAFAEPPEASETPPPDAAAVAPEAYREAFPPPEDPRPYAGSPHAERIDRALHYALYKNRHAGRWMHYTILDFLRRKFGLADRYAIEHTFAPHLRFDIDPRVPETFRRMVERDFMLDAADIASRPEVEKFALHALYCDVYPLTDDQAQKMLEYFIDPDPLHLLSKAATYQWMRENGCLGALAPLRQQRAPLAVALRNLVETLGPENGTAIQGMAMLYYLGFDNMVKPEWIETVARVQQADGGWTLSGKPDGDESDGGVSIFALWALLEAALPNVPRTPWLVGAGETSEAEENAN